MLRSLCTAKDVKKPRGEGPHLVRGVMLYSMTFHWERRVLQLLESHIGRRTLLFQQRVGVQIETRPLTAGGIRGLQVVSLLVKVQYVAEQVSIDLASMLAFLRTSVFSFTEPLTRWESSFWT